MKFHGIELTGSFSVKGSGLKVSGSADTSASFGNMLVAGFGGDSNIVTFSSSLASRMQNASAGGGEFSAGDSGSISGRLSGISGSLGANASLIRSLNATGISGSFAAVSHSLQQRLQSEESDFTAAGISGSLGTNASLIRSLTAAGISGSLGTNASLIRSLTAAGISGSLSAAGVAGLGARIISASSDTVVDLNGKKLLFSNVYTNEGDLPSATDNHGMFAHVHGTGLAYFAHAGAWHKLALHSGNISGSAQLASAISGSLGANASLIRSLNATGITGSFALASGGFSDRITDDSGSFATRIQNAAAGGGEFAAGDSGSISGRLSGISGSLGVNASLIRSLTAVGISGSFAAVSHSLQQRLQSEESDFTAAGISGSLGANANLIRSLTATGITGSFAAASGGFSNRVTSFVDGTATKISGSGLSTGSFGRIQATTIGGNSPLKIESDNFNVSTAGVVNATTITATSFTGVFDGVVSGSSQLASAISGSLGANAALIRSLTATGITGSFALASGGFSDRITDDSGSFATRIQNAAAGGGEFAAGDSGSISGRLSGISGSLGANASLIRSLTATGITGSFAVASGGFEQRLEAIEVGGTDDDLTIAGDSGGNLTIDMDSETLTIAGGDNITTSGAGNTITITNDFTLAGISGSLGTNAALIRSLNATGISGSLGANASLIRSLTAVGITGSFALASGGFSDRITDDSGSFATRIQNAAAGGGEFNAGDSGSISGRLSGISGSLGANASLIRSLTAVGITGSFAAASGGFSDRLEAAEDELALTLISASAQIASAVSGAFAESSQSIDNRIDTIEGRNVIAGTGLTGGGTLAADRTLNVVGGTGITANANDIAVDFTDSTLQNTITGSFAAASGGFSDRISAKGVESAIVHDQIVASARWAVTHSLNNQYPTITVWGPNDTVVVPATIKGDNANQLTITFTQAITGKAVMR